MTSRTTQIVRLNATTALAALGLASVGLSSAAHAQVVPSEAVDETATPSSSIIVTGSRISNPNLEQASPVTVISQEEIGFRQPVSAESFLRELPGVVPNIGPGVNNGTNGSAQLDLRGLGANRNLILINGQRTVPASLASVTDLNIVPVALIERVDVLTGGASTAYGADAVAGVVNFITRRDFSGVDLTANFGITERGDGNQGRIDLTTGANFDDGRGNAVLSMGYAKTTAIQQGERDSGLFSLSSTTGNPQGSPTSSPASILSPLLGRVNADGTAFETGVLGDFNFNPLNVYQTPFERYNIFGSADYEVFDGVEVFTQAFYTKTVVDQIIAPSGTFFTTVQLPLNNPFLTPVMRQQLCQAGIDLRPIGPGGARIGATPIRPDAAQCAPIIANGTEIPAQIGRRFTEAGPRLTNFTTNTFQVSGGVRADLTETFAFEVSGLYGESERTNTSNNQGTRSRLQQALRAVNPTTCTVTAGGCVPLNLFGVDGSLTDASFNFLNVTTFNFIQTSLKGLQANVSGDFGISSPFAVSPFSVALGVEYREYVGASGGDGISSQPGEVLGAGAPALPITGDYNTKEVFGEIYLPLIEDRPFFDSLTVNAGARYSDYSTSGGNWAYNVGGTWEPIPDIRFRGSYARAVRAPNLFELFQPQVTFLTNRAIDPCQGTTAEITARGANFVPLCQAQLALVGANASLLGTIPQPAAGQINATTGGNPALQPEIGDTLTLGVVLQPRFLSAVSLTLDYYDIKVEDAISSPSQADVIDGCFTGSNPGACGTIRRNPLTGSLSGPNDTTFGPFLGLSNSGIIETSGFDLGFNFRQELGFARLNMSFIGNHTLSSKFQANPASRNRECVGFYSVSCASIQPEWSWNLRTTVTLPSETDISLLWRHLSSVSVEPADQGGPANIFEDFRTIPAYDAFDLSLQQRLNDMARVTFTVSNLLDKDPPIVGNTIGATAYNSGNTYPSTYDAIGRRYSIGLNLTF